MSEKSKEEIRDEIITIEAFLALAQELGCPNAYVEGVKTLHKCMGQDKEVRSDPRYIEAAAVFNKTETEDMEAA